MFVTGISTAGPKNIQTINDTDLTPARFKIEFDEPIELQNALIELVSTKITKNNKINIQEPDNTLLIRLGTDAVSSQYQAKIPVGSYDIDELSTAIQSALNEIVPLNSYKGFEVTKGSAPPPSNTNKIQIKFKMLANPSVAEFFNHIDINGDNTSQLPFSYDIDKSTPNTIAITNVAQQGIENVSPFVRPSTEFEFCGSLDVGENIVKFDEGVDTKSRIGVDDFGIWEKDGYVEAIVKPVKCMFKSTFDVGYNGYSGTTNKPTYFTFEIRNDLTEFGFNAPSPYKDGTLFGDATKKFNIPRKYDGIGHRQINGVLNAVVNQNDPRGEPYDKKHQFFFPNSVEQINGSATNHRIINYDTNWSGQISLRQPVGRQPAVPLQPNGYTFQIDSGDAGQTDVKARSVVKRVGFLKERINMRPSRQTYFKGLQIQTSTGATLGTFLEAGASVSTLDAIHLSNTGVLPSPPVIKYIVNSVGQFNFANPLLDANGNDQNTNASGDKIPPFYKILEVDANFQPTKVALCDGGEFTRTQSAPTTKEEDLARGLFFNDPNTYEIISGNTFDDEDESQFLNNIPRVIPSSANISEDVFLQQAYQFRIPSFNLGLMRDNHYRSVKNISSPVPIPDVVNGALNPLTIPKDIEVNIQSIFRNSGGGALPATGQLKVSCFQYIPVNDDEENTPFDLTSGFTKTLLNATSNTWNSVEGSSGTALANWASFGGVESATCAIKLTIENTNIYEQSIKCSYTNDLTATPPVFSEEVILVKTGVQRGGGASNMEAVMKTRFFPLHPLISMATATNASADGLCSCNLTSVGSVYNDRKIGYITDKTGLGFGSNYEANLSHIIGPRPSQRTEFTSDAIGANFGNHPLVLVKSGEMNVSNIIASATNGTTNQIVASDLTGTASLYDSGLPRSMYAKIQAGNTEVDFPLGETISSLAYLPSFAVEILNLPTKSYIGKGFDFGKPNNLRGSGQTARVIGINPAKEFTTSGTLPVKYTYESTYSKPVQVRLPTKQFFYHFEIALKNINDGQLLKDLLHTTEVIFLIHPLE